MIDLNGQASFPLTGDIKAADQSVAELRRQVKSILSTKAFRPRELDQQGRLMPRDDVITVSPDEVVLTVAEYRPIYLNGDVATPRGSDVSAGNDRAPGHRACGRL
jgi:polysaccharide export outer membrane protein